MSPDTFVPFFDDENTEKAKVLCLQFLLKEITHVYKDVNALTEDLHEKKWKLFWQVFIHLPPFRQITILPLNQES